MELAMFLILLAVFVYCQSKNQATENKLRQLVAAQARTIRALESMPRVKESRKTQEAKDALAETERIDRNTEESK